MGEGGDDDGCSGPTKDRTTSIFCMPRSEEISEWGEEEVMVDVPDQQRIARLRYFACRDLKKSVNGGRRR